MTRFSDQNKKIGQARVCSSTAICKKKISTLNWVQWFMPLFLILSSYQFLGITACFVLGRTLAHIQPNSKDGVHCKPSHFGYVSWQGRGEWPSFHILVYAIFLFVNGTRWKFSDRKIS
jgi:hypothetical protein